MDINKGILEKEIIISVMSDYPSIGYSKSKRALLFCQVLI
jgi:hypothetical protein